MAGSGQSEEGSGTGSLTIHAFTHMCTPACNHLHSVYTASVHTFIHTLYPYVHVQVYTPIFVHTHENTEHRATSRMDKQKKSLTFYSTLSSHNTGIYTVNKKWQMQPDCTLFPAHSARTITRSAEVDATHFHILK